MCYYKNIISKSIIRQYKKNYTMVACVYPCMLEKYKWILRKCSKKHEAKKAGNTAILNESYFKPILITYDKYN